MPGIIISQNKSMGILFPMLLANVKKTRFFVNILLLAFMISIMIDHIIAIISIMPVL